MLVTARIEEKVFEMIKEHKMLQPGDKAVVGVSGGADSVCLLFVLTQWAKKVPLKLAVAHINHGMREDASEDAEYVRRLCEELKLPFYQKNVDVRKLAADKKLSEEEAGRQVRYQAFETAAQSFGADKIAVAHTCNDLAETMLFHLFRGAGLSGLCGIRPVRDNIIRPILCLERQEVEEYLRARGILYRTDSTNESDDYTRNRIRHHILPYAQEQIQTGAVANMARTAGQLLETEAYLEEQTQMAYRQCVREKTQISLSANGKCEIDVSAFLALHPVIGRHLLLKLVKELAFSAQNISYVHIRDLMTLFNREGNRIICLPYRIRARREYSKVILEREPELNEQAFGKRAQEAKFFPELPKYESAGTVTDDMSDQMSSETVAAKMTKDILSESVQANIQEKTVETQKDSDREAAYTVSPDKFSEEGFRLAVEGLGEMDFTVFSHEKMKDIPQNRYTKWFDYDKMKGSLILRHRETGDYLSIGSQDNGTFFHKTVKSYMIAEKIPRTQRDQLWLLAQKNHIIWVIGGRISEYFKISENTKRILQVQLRRDCIGSGTEEHNGRACESDVDRETGR